MALFDVLMPVRNGEAYLAEAIASIQAQTLKDWRLLVLDHGSTDRTAEIADRIAQSDPRVQRLCFPEAVGLAGLLNEGLARVDAPYALRMDADDLSLPERMALTLAAFQAHPELAVIGGQAEVIDAHGRRLSAMRLPTDREQIGRVALFRNPLAHPTVCFNSAVLADRRLRYGQSIHAGVDPLATIRMPALAEDYLLFGELAIEGLTANLPQEVLRYRFHAGGVSRQKFTDQMAASAEVARHLAALVCRHAGVPAFDPVPFGSHGETLLQVGDASDYRSDYRTMCDALRRVDGVWLDHSVELRWRGVYVDRSPIGLLARAGWLSRACRPDAHERRTVFNAVRKIVLRRSPIAVPFDPMPT